MKEWSAGVACDAALVEGGEDEDACDDVYNDSDAVVDAWDSEGRERVGGSERRARPTVERVCRMFCCCWANTGTRKRGFVRVGAANSCMTNSNESDRAALQSAKTMSTMSSSYWKRGWKKKKQTYESRCGWGGWWKGCRRLRRQKYWQSRWRLPR